MIVVNMTIGNTVTDITSFVDLASIHIAEAINQPSQMTFSMYNITNQFVRPVQRAYIQVYSTLRDRSLFTGFISVEPTRTFLAVAGVTLNRISTAFPGATIPTQLFRHDISCTSDEHLLNIKAVQFIPAFVNQTQGDILTILANTLASGYFDTSNIASGDIVPYFQYDPSKSWSEVAKSFGDGSRFRYKARDKALAYVPYGDVPLGIIYDENKSQSSFDPKGLQTTVLATPIVNDVTIVGDTEAGNNREDYVIADGFTGDFPLRHKVFRGTSSVLLQETWKNNELNTQQWTLNDPFSNFDFSAGALNILSSEAAPAPDYGLSYLSMNNGVELAGGLNLQHGEITFNDYCSGIIGGLYNDPFLNASGSPSGFLSTASGEFLGGFEISTPGAITLGASGAAGIHIQPVWANLPVGPFIETQENHTYVLQTVVHAPQYVRYQQIFRTIDGEVFGGGGKYTTGSVTFIIQDYDIGLASGFFYQPEVTQSSVDQVPMPNFAVYALINNIALNVTVDNTTIAVMPLGGLSAIEGPDGLSIPTGAVLPLLPPQRGGYIGPVLPWPSPYSGNILPAPLLRGTMPTQLVLGNGFQLQAAQISQGNSADKLSFYDQTIPTAGTPVRLQTWEAQAAVSRLQNFISIAEEAFIVGDDGLRSAIVPDLNPLPRTSEDCDSAGQAFLNDRGHVFYNGTYNCTSLFLRGLTSDDQYWPTVGRFLDVNAPMRGIDDQKYLVTTLSITIVDASTELLGFSIGFGADLYLEKVLKNFVDLKPPQVLTPNDTSNPPNPRFTQNAENAFLPDISDLRAVSIEDFQVLCQSFMPNPWDIEIRLQDTNWGRGHTFDYVKTAHPPSFFLTRTQLDQVWYMRFVAVSESKGFVDVSGSVVSLVSGSEFSLLWPNYTEIIINNVAHPIAAVSGSDLLGLAVPIGNMTNVPYYVAPLTSRRSKAIRIRYPMTPAPPRVFHSASGDTQFDFAGDIRSIYGLEIRSAFDGQPITVCVQIPATSFAVLDINWDATPIPYLLDQAGSGSVLSFPASAYFFNHQWNYSSPTAFTGYLASGNGTPIATFAIGVGGSGQAPGTDIANPMSIRLDRNLIEGWARNKIASANPVTFDVKLSRDQGATWDSVFTSPIVVPGGSTDQIIQHGIAIPNIKQGDWLRLDQSGDTVQMGTVELTGLPA